MQGDYTVSTVRTMFGEILASSTEHPITSNQQKTSKFQYMKNNKPVSLHVSIPANLKKAVAKRVKEGMFSNSSDYIRHIIRKDIEKMAYED